jgi:hypothetical protein
MTTYLTYEGQPPRTESNPEVIANLVRKGWVVSEPPVVEEVVATFTAEEIVAQYFSPTKSPPSRALKWPSSKQASRSDRR